MKCVYAIFLDEQNVGSYLFGIFDSISYAKEELDKLKKNKRLGCEYRISRYEMNKIYNEFNNYGED